MIELHYSININQFKQNLFHRNFDVKMSVRAVNMAALLVAVFTS